MSAEAKSFVSGVINSEGDFALDVENALTDKLIALCDASSVQGSEVSKALDDLTDLGIQIQREITRFVHALEDKGIELRQNNTWEFKVNDRHSYSLNLSLNLNPLNLVIETPEEVVPNPPKDDDQN